MGGARFNSSDGLVAKGLVETFFDGAATDHVERCLLSDTPIDEALLLGDVHVSEDVVTKALSRSPSVNTLRALKFTRASEDYLAKALEDEDLRKHALLLLDDHEDALTLALKHYGGTLSDRQTKPLGRAQQTGLHRRRPRAPDVGLVPKRVGAPVALTCV